MSTFFKNFRSIRWRLTFWFISVLAIALAIFSISVYLAMRQALNSQLETALYDGTIALADNLDHEFEEGDPVQEAADSVALESSFRNMAVKVYGPSNELIAASNDFQGTLDPQPQTLQTASFWKKGAPDQGIRHTEYDTGVFKVAVIRVAHAKRRMSIQ